MLINVNNSVVINGQKFEGSNITINNNEIIVDGKRVSDLSTIQSKEIKIEINGNINNLECASATIYGNVKNVDASSVSITGNVEGDVDGSSINIGGSVAGDVDGVTVNIGKK